MEIGQNAAMRLVAALPLIAWLPGTAPSGENCATCGRGAFGVAGAGTGKDSLRRVDDK